MGAGFEGRVDACCKILTSIFETATISQLCVCVWRVEAIAPKLGEAFSCVQAYYMGEFFVSNCIVGFCGVSSVWFASIRFASIRFVLLY